MEERSIAWVFKKFGNRGWERARWNTICSAQELQDTRFFLWLWTHVSPFRCIFSQKRCLRISGHSPCLCAQQAATNLNSSWLTSTCLFGVAKECCLRTLSSQWVKDKLMKEKSEEHEVGIVDGARTLRRGLEGRGGGDGGIKWRVQCWRRNLSVLWVRK